MEGRKKLDSSMILKLIRENGLKLGEVKNEKDVDPDLGNYYFNPHSHVRIWLTADENVFLNQENQLRLIRLRVNNPADTISLIYDRRLLSDVAQKELYKFCAAHRIAAIDLEDLKPDLANEQEKELMAYVEEEIRHAKDNTGGNFGAASDILRWLTPIIKIGAVYSDFDTNIVTLGLSGKVSSRAPIILNLGSVVIPLSVNARGSVLLNAESKLVCNDILVIPTPNPDSPEFVQLQRAQNQIINSIQLEILQNYRRRHISLKEIRQMYPDSSDVFSQMSSEQNDKDLAEISGEDIFAVRRKIQSIFATNAIYIFYSLKSMLHADDDMANLFVARFNCSLEEAIQAGSFEQRLQAFFIEQIKKIVHNLGVPAPDLADDELMESLRIKSETVFYKLTVMNMSGPTVLAVVLNSLVTNIDEFRTYSWEHHGLDSHFKSGQRLKFKTPLEKIIPMLTSKTGERCDESWLRAGQEASREREKKMHEAATSIQRFFRKHLEKNSKKHAGEKVYECRARRI